ncbi:hypothetical protein L3X38_032223 [Prunus dulcis]|uniref:Uncharacterized protein n=1 Tax=Prunus dulcis TaxID=3755 RepID=A0AAD4YVQ2_PRUDU|nr:hypothetical protein L3X38_032223 [Prunus dulcis]
MPKLVQLDLENDMTIAKVDEVFFHGESQLMREILEECTACQEEESCTPSWHLLAASSFFFCFFSCSMRAGKLAQGGQLRDKPWLVALRLRDEAVAAAVADFCW